MLLNDKDINDETMVITTDGRTFDSEWDDKAVDFWERSIDDVDEKFEGRKVKHPVSFADFVPQQFRQRLLSSSLFPRDLIEPIIHCFINSEMIDSACSLSNLNLLEYNGYGDPPGEYENELKNGGYRPFINYLRSFIPDEKQIRLNCEVQRVKYMERERKLLVEMVDLRTEEKKFMLCDQIIWTTSLGFLKENFQRIFASERLLIEQKQNAIDQIGFGILNKVQHEDPCFSR
ncbi:unnamed protein product [Adineta ricciae]|uniref:Amine oxidase domain-containing protein n=1 Tax=Adineta ricciae TaxID=249248 RepID=A0A815NLE8_ADIRI|nr:unnamed protein product [Adineta ricciae]